MSLYIPDVGERVRIAEVDPQDRTAAHRVGEIITVARVVPTNATYDQCNDHDAHWLLVYAEGFDEGNGRMLSTWCRVEPVARSAETTAPHACFSPFPSYPPVEPPSLDLELAAVIEQLARTQERLARLIGNLKTQAPKATHE